MKTELWNIQTIFLLVVFWCFFSSVAEGSSWDRIPPPPPQLSFQAALQITVRSETLFAQTLRKNTAPLSNTKNESSSGVYSCGAKLAANYTSLLLLYGGMDELNTNQAVLWMLPWPMEATRSRQQRWTPAPTIGYQPVAPNSHSFVTTPSPASPFSGTAFAYGGVATSPRAYGLSSLWTLSLETAQWTPLGPSLMKDLNRSSSYNCSGMSSIWQDGSVLQCDIGIGTVDACAWSQIGVAQTDEFGCPWPAARYDHSMVIVDEALYLIGGAFASTEVVGEVWRLKMDAALGAATQQQSVSKNGQYVYNEHQAMYLNDPTDQRIDRSQLCPVKWELLTRADGTASLKSSPATSSFPVNRCSATASASSNGQIYVVGGKTGIGARSPVATDGVWVLDTRSLAWLNLQATPLSTGYLPTARSSHAAFLMQLDSIQNYISDAATNPLLQSCATASTSALVIGRGDSPDLKRDMWLLLPSCDAVLQQAQNPLSTLDQFNCSNPNAVSMPTNANSLTWNWFELPLNYTAVNNLYGNGVFVQLRDWNIIRIGGSGGVMAKSPHFYDLRRKVVTSVDSPFASFQLPSLADHLDPPRVVPKPRQWHTSFLMANEQMLVYGGSGADEAWNQMWQYCGRTYRWTLIGQCTSLPASPATILRPSTLWPPFTRSAAVAIFNSSYLIQFGGGLGPSSSATIDCNSHMYMYDISANAWTNLTDLVTSATVWTGSVQDAAATGGVVVNGFLYPRGRCRAKAVNVGDQLLMFGGELDHSSGSSGIDVADNALWSFQLTRLAWTLVQPSNLSLTSDNRLSVRPAPRTHHSMVAISDHEFFLAFGLLESMSTIYSSTWLYSTASATWTLISTSNTQPSGPGPRFDAQMVFSRAKVLTYSGQELLGPVQNDMFVMDISSRTWRSSFSDPSNSPDARTGATLVADDSAREMFLYGSDVDAAVHVLHTDSVSAGGDITLSIMPHNLLSSIQFSKTAASLVFPSQVVYRDSLAMDRMSTVSTNDVLINVVNSRERFVSLACAFTYVQQSLQATFASITILDTLNHTSRLTRALASTPVKVSLILASQQFDGLLGVLGSTSTVMRTDIPPAIIQPDAGCTDCGLVIETNSEVLSYSTTITNPALIPTVIMRGLVFQGYAGSNAVVVRRSRVTFANVTMTGNSADVGGALMIDSGRVQISYSVFNQNSASVSGGAVYVINSNVAIDHSNFTQNSIVTSLPLQIGASSDLVNPSTKGQGGAIASYFSVMNISSSFFQSNSAVLAGAISSVGLGSTITGVESYLGLQPTCIRVSRSTFDHNTAMNSGGAIMLQNVHESGLNLPILNSCTFTSNSAYQGGAVSLFSSGLSSFNSTFLTNRATSAGGAIFHDSASSPSFDPPFSQARNLPPNEITSCPSSFTDLVLLAYDVKCNSAAFGPCIASPPTSLRIESSVGGIASNYLQLSFALISPPIVLNLVDAYGQVVTTDSSTFVSIGPLWAFGGTTSVQAVSGQIVFDEVLFRLPPNQTVNAVFSSSTFLPSFAQDMANGLLTYPLRSRSDFSSGLSLSTSTSNSFAQIASCASGCTFRIPAPVNAHQTHLQITFNELSFSHEYDTLKILIDRGRGDEIFQAYSGNQIALNPAVHINLTEYQASSSLPSKPFVVDIWVPSALVTLSLQTGDDRVNYVSGAFNHSLACPQGLLLFAENNSCLELKSSSFTVRSIVNGVAIFGLCLLLVCSYFLYRLRHSQTVRATSRSASLVVLIGLAAIYASGMMFAIVFTHSTATNAMCLAPIWLQNLGVIAILAVCLMNLRRFALIAQQHNNLKPAPDASCSRKLWTLLLLGIEVVFLVICTAMNLIEMKLEVDSSGAVDFLRYRCANGAAFDKWLAAQKVYFLVLVLISIYYAYRSRRIAIPLHESRVLGQAVVFFVLEVLVLMLMAAVIPNPNDSSVTVLLRGGGAVFLALVWTVSLLGAKVYSLRQLERARMHQEELQVIGEKQAKITAASMMKLKVTPSPRHNMITVAQAIAKSPSSVSERDIFSRGKNSPDSKTLAAPMLQETDENGTLHAALTLPTNAATPSPQAPSRLNCQSPRTPVDLPINHLSPVHFAFSGPLHEQTVRLHRLAPLSAPFVPNATECFPPPLPSPSVLEEVGEISDETPQSESSDENNFATARACALVVDEGLDHPASEMAHSVAPAPMQPPAPHSPVDVTADLTIRPIAQEVELRIAHFEQSTATGSSSSGDSSASPLAVPQTKNVRRSSAPNMLKSPVFISDDPEGEELEELNNDVALNAPPLSSFAPAQTLNSPQTN